MSGSGLQLARYRREDRFYCPPKARKALHNQQNDQLYRAKSDLTVSHPLPVKEKRDSENQKACDEPVKCADTSDSEPSLSPSCNLERFMAAIKPSLLGNYISTTTRRGWKTCEVKYRPYFVLSDLWDSFKEWSVYGAGVPLVLNESDYVVQYYVPYLSGIQIYVDSAKALLKSSDDSSDGDYFRDLSSDCSSDCESEKAFQFREQNNCQWLPTDLPININGLSLRETDAASYEGFSSDENDCPNSQGHLLFEYLEQDRPYLREPLSDKISDLASHFPELGNLRSCDLLPSSWFSVAWYPIYRIPTGPTLRDLDACFLTFHSLHTPIIGARGGVTYTYPNGVDGLPKVSLPIFGLASYKLKGSLWAPSDRNSQLVTSLWQSADRWLKFLQVKHPDFLFFSGR